MNNSLKSQLGIWLGTPIKFLPSADKDLRDARNDAVWEAAANDDLYGISLPELQFNDELDCKALSGHTAENLATTVALISYGMAGSFLL